MNLEALKEIQQSAAEAFSTYKSSLMVCAGTACVAGKSLPLIDAFNEELRKRGLENKYLVVPTGCNGFCAQGPIMVVQPEGIFYQKLTGKDIPEIIENHLEGGEPVQRLLYHIDGAPVPRMDDIPFFGKQKLLALRHRGMLNPESIQDYIRIGGYSTIQKVLTTMKPDEVTDTLVKSGLRGRGGGGFPAGVKWQSCVKAVEK